jgi:hypothetical protein
MTAIDFDRVALIATALRPCPFCACRGLLTRTAGHDKFGVRCCGCEACLPEIHLSPEYAIGAWSLRRGTASYYGGKSTKGISSRQKRRACRRNLKKARNAKFFKRLLAQNEEKWVLLKKLRQEEMAEAQEQAALSRARLKILGPKIFADPQLSRFYRLLQNRNPDPAISG